MNSSNKNIEVNISVNKVQINDLIQIHYECDDDFEPKLSSRVDIRQYCQKLISNAVIVAIRNKKDVIGILAIYCNDTTNKTAYISSVCVSKKFRGKGYSKILLDKAIELSSLKGFKRIKLEVGKNNIAAISLYNKFGFHKIKEEKESIFMEYDIEN